MLRPKSCPRISVIICTLNEEQNLPRVLPRVPDWVDEIMLVDGHSTDNTVSVAKQIRPEVKVLSQPGRGKADALQFGIRQASSDIIVCLDADGDTPPEDLERFVKPLLDGYDFAKGSRLAEGRPRTMSRYNWLGNKLLALACNMLFGTRFTDICAGYYSLKKEQFLQLSLTYSWNEDGCSMEQQMVVRAKKAGMRIKEVPYSSRGRIAGKSVISGLMRTTKQGFVDLFVILKERFRG
jgi:glycosyltransferase involved in cell wall biosynthesis